MNHDAALLMLLGDLRIQLAQQGDILAALQEENEELKKQLQPPEDR